MMYTYSTVNSNMTIPTNERHRSAEAIGRYFQDTHHAARSFDVTIRTHTLVMRKVQAVVISCSVLLVSGALQQDKSLYSVESFASQANNRPSFASWLTNLLPPSSLGAKAKQTSSVSHQLYDISSFRSVHDRQFGGGMLDRFKTRSTRGGSSVANDGSESDSSASALLSPLAHKKPYTVVTTLVHGNGKTSLVAGCDIIEAKQTTRLIALWDDNTPALWKTSAFLSDTLIVGMTERTTMSPLLTQALQAGLVARKAQKLSKPRLVFALHVDSRDKSQLTEWREELVVNELAGISERLVDSFHVTAAHELRTQKLKSRKGGISKVAEPETFPRLMEQVHFSFGGSEQSLLKVREQQECKQSHESKARIELVNRPKKEGEKISKQDSTKHNDTTQAKAAPAVKQPEPEPTPDPTLVLEAALAQLELLQEQQDDASIEAASGAMPFDFAKHASPILELIVSSMTELPIEDQAVLQQQIGVHIQQLYTQQLASLRDYYGRLYETILDQTDNVKEWKTGINRVLEQFKKAAASAVPAKADAFGELDLQYLCNCAASGLRDDMLRALELRQEVEIESDTEETASAVAKKQIPAWYKKLAARGLVLGVNYFQGWLAWQGIKHAALQRERNLPKFPLF